MLWKIIIVLGAAIASYFIPTPKEMQKAFTAGQNFYASSNFEKAIEQYDFIINTQSDFLNEDSVRVELLSGEYIVSVVVAAYYQKANALKNLKRQNEAIEIFRIVESRKDEPKLAALAQFQIYDLFYRSADYLSAIKEARKLVDKYPSNKKAETALYDIGWAYKELGNYEESNSAFTELIEKYPSTDYLPRAIYQLGQNNYEQKHYEHAIEYWADLNQRFKPEAFQDKDWENVQLKAVKDRQIFEATAGRETDETVLELVAKAQVKIGDAYRQRGNYNLAISNYRKVVSTYTLLPQLIEASYVKMADYTLSERGIDSARAVYQSAIDENFSNKQFQGKMQYKIAEMYQNNELFSKAASEYEFYINGYGDVAEAINFGVDKAQYSIVAMYFNAKKYSESNSWADSLLFKYPFSDVVPGALFLKGLSLNSLERYAEARGVFQKILNEHAGSPDEGEAKVQIGFAYFKEKKYEEALRNYLEALNTYSHKIDTSHVYFDLISTYYEMSRYDEAIAAFDRVKFGSPYYAAAFGKMTKIYGARSEYDKGKKFLEDILEKSKSADSIYYGVDVNFALADLYISQNDYNGSINYLNKVIADSIADESKNVIKMQAQFARGALWYQLENFGEAVKDFEALKENSDFVSRFPDNQASLTEKLALAYSKTNKKQKALELVNQLIASSKSDTEKGNYYSIISKIYFESGDYNKAIESANNVIKQEGISDETKVSSYITLSQSYKNLGQLSKSSEILFEASEKYPASSEIPAVLYSLAALYFDNREYEKAGDIFNKFIIRYPENPSVKEAKYFRAHSYFEAGNWSQAHNFFKQYASSYPGDPLAAESQYFASEALFNAKDYNKAINEYRIVYQRFPNTDYAAQALYNEGWAYYELKQSDKMIETFKRLASKYPNSSYAGDGLFTIGDYYYNSKDYLKSAEAYNELIAKFPNYPKIEEAKALVYDLSQINSYLEYEQAMKYFDGRKYEKAIEELTKLYNKYPDASIAVGCQVNIAASYEMLEEYRDAAEWYRKIIKRYADSKDDNERGALNFAKEHLEWIEDNYL